MTRMALFLVALLLGLGLPAYGHGGRFRGPRGGVPPGLPEQPSAPGASGGSFHSWTTWWSYNRFQHLDFRRRQNERRGPITGKRQKPEDPNAWRGDVRERLTPLMLEALGDEDEEVRTAAAVALGKWRVQKAVPRLKELFHKDDVKQVRESALLGLMLVRDAQLREFFEPLANDHEQDLRIRGFALLGIGLIGDEPSRTYLLGLLDPGNKKARRHLPRKKKERREYRTAAIFGLTQAKADLSSDFLRIARDTRLDEDVRACALSALGKTGAKTHVPMLLEILKTSNSDQMRRSAVIALGALATAKDDEVVTELGRRVKTDRDRIVVHFATLSLGQIGGPEAFALLRKYYKRSNKEGRSFFLIAAGLSKHADAAAFLKEQLQPGKLKDARDVSAAIMALGLLEDEQHTPTVREKFEKAKDWMLLQSSMVALGILNDQLSADAVKAVLISRRQPAVMTSAALSYALLRPWTSIPVFTDLLQTAKGVVALTAISQIMGLLSSPRAVDPLLELYKNKKLQRQARAFALVSLGSLGDPEDIPVFIRLAFDINYFIRSDPVDEAVTIL
ncbi:MAG: HEAT repeat domain-containing protein [Planctomycetota bacterium]